MEIDETMLATLATSVLTIISTVVAVYFKQSSGKTETVLGETLALVQDMNLGLTDLKRAMSDGVVTADEITQLENVLTSSTAHVQKIQTALGIKM